MASSQIHFRSISLPSRLHPLNSAELRKLDSCISNDAPATSEAIRSGLLRLAELYTSRNHRQDRKSVEDALESSTQLLDSCNTVTELIQMIRENVRALQSAFRRKGVAGAAVQDDVNSYFCIRKKMNKSISKSLKALKCLENKTRNGSCVDREATTETTIDIFRSSLVFLSCPAAGRSGGWNLISRLTMMTKSADSGAIISEVACVDSALNGLRHGDHRSKLDAFDVQRSLRNLDACVEGIEAGLQRLFRQLLQSRVALLNVLTDQ